MKFNKSNIRLAIFLIIVIAFICSSLTRKRTTTENYAEKGIDNEAFEKQMALQKQDKFEGYYRTNQSIKDFVDVIW